MPRIRSSPPVTGETAAIIRMVEDLPAPLGPRKPNASPRRTSMSMPLTASTVSPSRPLNDLRTSRAEIIASLLGWDTSTDPTNHRRHAANQTVRPEPYGVPMQRRHARSGSPYEERIGFSRAVRLGSTVSVSGTAPIWPDGHVDPEPAAQARRCWQVVLAALEQLGA